MVRSVGVWAARFFWGAVVLTVACNPGLYGDSDGGEAGRDGGGDSSASPEEVGVGDGGGASRLLRREGDRLVLDGQPFLALGVNKFDLFHQYLGVASERLSPDEQRALAAEALDQIAAAGLRVVRVAASPRWPAQMQYWRSSSVEYWATFDDMVREARARDVKLIPVVWINPFLFADVAGEPLRRTFAKGSSSQALLLEYARDLAKRYGRDDTILLWELTDALNAAADQDFAVRTSAWIDPRQGTPSSRAERDNFSTDNLVSTVQALAETIREVDAHHLLASGYGAPRPAAMHLRAHPEWAGADWTLDSEEELFRYLELTHPDPIDIVTVQFFNDGTHERFGRSGPYEVGLLGTLQRAAARLGKPLAVTAFGDRDPPLSEAPEGSFARRCALAFSTLRLPLALHWVWQYTPPEARQAVPESVDPARHGELVSVLGEVARWLRADPPEPSVLWSVPNPGFEDAGDRSDRADGWETVEPSSGEPRGAARRVVSAPEAFSGRAFLQLTLGDIPAQEPWYVLSEPWAVTQPGAFLLTVALRRHLEAEGAVSVGLVQYDAEGAEVGARELTLAGARDPRFRVEYLRDELNPRTSSVRLRLGIRGPAGSSVDIDGLEAAQVAAPEDSRD